MSSVTDDDTDHWLDLDTNYSIPSQTVDEILAENDNGLDDDFFLVDDDDSCGLNKPISPIHLTYHLDCPLLLETEDVIAHQVNMVKDRPNGGKATCIAVSEQHVAVGTVKGMAILFDKKDGKLLCFTGNTENAPVSALGFNTNSTSLAIGYSNGRLKILKTTTGKTRDFDDCVVQPDHGIIQVEYLNRSSLLVLDNGGSVFEIREGRKGPARCIFTGCKGEAVQVRAFPEENILLLSTLKQVLIFSQKTGRIISQLRLPDFPQAPPLVDYNIQIHSISKRSVIHDVRVATARQNEIRIYSMTSDGRNVTFPLSKIIKPQVESTICGMFWMDLNSIVVVTVDEKVSLIDAQRGTVTATSEIEAVELVYNLAEFKGLYTGGNVSPAFQYLAPNVCYQSAKRYSSSLYLLGSTAIYRCDLMTERQQLDRFLARKDVVSAVLYAMDVTNTVRRSNFANNNMFKFIDDKIPELLAKLLDSTMDGLESGRVTDLIEHYRKYITVLIKVCVEKKYFDILYNTIYPKIEKDGLAKSIFLEILEEHAVEGRLEHPPPELIHDLLTYLVNEGQFAQFESTVSHMPIECLDLHQVITTCRSNFLFDGLIYVMNNAMVDYVGPLEEMCCHVAEFIHKAVLSDFDIATGNKLLLYLSACLSGNSYPVGDLPPERAEVVPLEVYKFLVSLNHLNISQRTGRERYSVLHLLLQYDPLQFLNVISTCADAPIFAQSDGRLSRLIEILVGVTEENPKYMGILIPFITHLLETGTVTPNLHTYENLILRTIERISETNEQHVEEKIVNLIKVCDQMSEDRILMKAKQKPLISICAYIYIKRHEYVNLLLTCIEDKQIPNCTFDFINHLLDGVEESGQAQLRRFVTSSLNVLNRLDSERAARLYLERFPECLISSEQLPFDFLFHCFRIKSAEGSKSLCGDEDVDEGLFRSLFKGIIEERTRTGCNADDIDAELSDILLYWLPMGSRDDTCLNLASSQNLIDSTVILLLARKHYLRAFEALYERLEQSGPNHVNFEKRMMMIIEICKQSRDIAISGGWWVKLFNFILSTTQGDDMRDGYFTDIFTIIVETCGSQVSQVLDSLFSHPRLRSATFSNFNMLVTKILFSCQIDRQILIQTRNCIQVEAYDLLKRMSSTSRSLHSTVRTNACAVCGNDILQSFTIFDCGHLAHLECLDECKRKCPCDSKNVEINHIETMHNSIMEDTASISMFGQENLRLRPCPEPSDPF
ncbi:unnamed protein product [Bursaphelenchus okinawaensis]|uniref:RING-type domain-containing protein n=1 Tax=Bursaphelenchus okinawaensis TaxID=465554 RepID=A0A811KXN6_9BILA|nr:unnamed protein product [Bursaphelenchus okinawaensis]CAG9112736.1 unnamed protein product [Bursaphelenchus okinawaensis]